MDKKKKRKPPRNVTYPEPSEDDLWSFTYFVLNGKLANLYHQKLLVDAIWKTVNDFIERQKDKSLL